MNEHFQVIIVRDEPKAEQVCTVHGGSDWKGGYCDRWCEDVDCRTDAGERSRGPCVLPE